MRCPVPGVSEPHYLCKAKHYWDPDFCPGDFFLESSNAHLVFYQSVGLLTQFFSLEQTAWLGRIAALALLAWGWVRCVGRIVPGTWTGLWAMWMYLAIAAVGNWSGEWMVGGVEAKVFAYGFGFWAAAAWTDRQITRAALLAGLAVSFHPVVGGWMIISGAAATLAVRLSGHCKSYSSAEETVSPLPVDWAIAAGIFLLAALPGLWPAFELLGSVDPRQANLVTQIQVFDRLRHHLDPMTFKHGASAAYVLMVGLWLVVRYRLGWGQAERWFAWFTGASIVIALIGVALGYGERPIESVEQITWRYRLLKYYPFRLADILGPVAVSITAAGLIAQAASNRDLFNRWGSFRQARIKSWLLFAGLFVFSLSAPAVDRNPSRMDPDHLSDWLETCRWIRNETPADAMIWTPRSSWAFKWYARRAEYVSRKDCPQDAEGILEWNRRRQQPLHEAFQEEERLNFAILRVGRGRLRDQPVFENGHYRIYDLSRFSRKGSSGDEN